MYDKLKFIIKSLILLLFSIVYKSIKLSIIYILLSFVSLFYFIWNIC